MNFLKLLITFTILLISTSYALKSSDSSTAEITNSQPSKRLVKSGKASKSKYKSDVKSINAKTNSGNIKKTTAAPAADARTQGKLSTNVDFNDQLVGGKYQSPMEALSVVEDEKSIDDLIGVRKNFQDREERAKAMR